MTGLRLAWARLGSFFRKRELDREFDEELAAHLELATQDHVRQGMSLPEARRLALMKLGGVEPSKELHRESRGLPWLDGMIQDFRFALRALRRSPGFTLTAIATLALGIGVNAAVFTVTKAALFAGFPMVERNDRILYISTSRGCCVSYPDFEDWRAQAKSFSGMAIVHGVLRILSDPSGFPESYDATEVSSGTFQLAGQKPILGRDFAPSDEIAGAPPVAMLNYAFWERRFGKDPAIIGRTIRMNGAPTTVIGVMPRGFSFPQKQDLWVPLTPTAEVLKRDNRGQWFVFGRLVEGATVRSARVEMETIGRRLGDAYPSTNRGRNLLPIVQTFRDFFIEQNEAPIYWTMWAAVGFVLLIACANLANLLLARAMGKSREISVRVALGAGRWRIIRQLLVESVILSSLGGVLGWWLARWGVSAYALADRGPGRSSWRILDYSMDYRVLAYLIAVSVGTALLFGLAPALRLSKLDVNTALKDGGRSVIGGGRRLSSVLVVGEMALAVVLLAGAGLMIRSFFNIYKADLGVQTANILTMDLNLPVSRYPGTEECITFFDRIKRGLETIPGVESVAIARALPETGSAKLPYQFAGAPEVDEQRRPILSALTVGPGYFRTLGAAVVAGREFNDLDGASGAPAAIVNERFADEFWRGESPLGKHVRVFEGRAPGPWLTVVGVVSNIVQDVTRMEISPLVYLPYSQRPGRDMEVIARTRVPPGSLASAFRREMQALDSDLPVFGPFTLDERLEANYWTSGLDGVLFVIFAAIALLLASVGLYAVIAHSVSRRTQEIGIRMAIGATTHDIRRLVFMQGMLPLGIGLAIGLAGSLAVNRVLQSSLVHVSPADPITLAASSGVLFLAALLGCWVPARRAMRVDPVVALRHE
jgi:putative ABC transport system permease protein